MNKMADQKTIDAYNGQVNTYLKMVDELGVDPILLRFIDRLKVNDYVLDLGCGPALSVAPHQAHSAIVFCGMLVLWLRPGATMLAIAAVVKRRHPTHGLTERFHTVPRGANAACPLPITQRNHG